MHINNSHTNLFLLAFSVFCTLLLALRMLVTESFFYGFLVWNLFLAIIPYTISSWLYQTHWIRKNSFPLLLFLGIWLLFLPNAPYLITDLMHLRHARSSLSWLDPFMLFAFALNGLLFGILSMQHVFQLIEHKCNRKIATRTLFCIVFLCGFGIYLGRFLRWNSWELFSDPMLLLKDCVYSMLHPAYRVRTWGITLGFGTFLWLLFLSTQKIMITKKASRQ